MHVSDMISHLKSVILTLESATQFSNVTIKYLSPVEPLIEASIEILLLLRTALMDEHKGPLPRTPEIKFLENEQDSLGNPKQIKFSKWKRPVRFGPDPRAGNLLLDMISYLIQYKNHLEIPFHEEFKDEMLNPFFKDSRLVCNQPELKLVEEGPSLLRTEREYLQRLRQYYFTLKEENAKARKRNQTNAFKRIRFKESVKDLYAKKKDPNLRRSRRRHRR